MRNSSIKFRPDLVARAICIIESKLSRFYGPPCINIMHHNVYIVLTILLVISSSNCDVFNT